MVPLESHEQYELNHGIAPDLYYCLLVFAIFNWCRRLEFSHHLQMKGVKAHPEEEDDAWRPLIGWRARACFFELILDSVFCRCSTCHGPSCFPPSDPFISQSNAPDYA